ncbi:hypothetical protein [Streptosporangium canum]|uniref:hypothetical protein n=1 Tax=Streptosporangium canum TaxID=324952 RepID=UPI0034235657
MAYLVLFMPAYLAGLILLAPLRFRPDWLRALVAAVAVYAIAPQGPGHDARESAPNARPE